jgi:hypothetical protein
VASSQHTTSVVIDGEQIKVHQRHLTGEELRNLISPPAEHIWLDVLDAQDHPVAAAETLKLTDGMRFFTDRPRTTFPHRPSPRTTASGETSPTPSMTRSVPARSSRSLRETDSSPAASQCMTSPSS